MGGEDRDIDCEWKRFMEIGNLPDYGIALNLEWLIITERYRGNNFISISFLHLSFFHRPIKIFFCIFAQGKK